MLVTYSLAADIDSPLFISTADSISITLDDGNLPSSVTAMARLPGHDQALVGLSNCALGLLDLSNFDASPQVTNRFTLLTDSTICDLTNYDSGDSSSPITVESAQFKSVTQILELTPDGGKYAILDAAAKNIRLLDWCTGEVTKLSGMSYVSIHASSNVCRLCFVLD